MWCMMNSPLMLGLDLRRVSVGDDLYNIIANRELIALNQDALGVQAKRIYTSAPCSIPEKDYIENIDRVDVLAKPLADGSVALSFINVSEKDLKCNCEIKVEQIAKSFPNWQGAEKFLTSKEFLVKDLWTDQEDIVITDVFGMSEIKACDSVTIKVSPK